MTYEMFNQLKATFIPKQYKSTVLIIVIIQNLNNKMKFSLNAIIQQRICKRNLTFTLNVQIQSKLENLGLKLVYKTLSFIIANNNTLQLWLGFSVVTVLHYSIYNNNYNVSVIY